MWFRFRAELSILANETRTALTKWQLKARVPSDPSETLAPRLSGPGPSQEITPVMAPATQAPTTAATPALAGTPTTAATPALAGAPTTAATPALAGAPTTVAAPAPAGAPTQDAWRKILKMECAGVEAFVVHSWNIRRGQWGKPYGVNACA